MKVFVILLVLLSIATLIPHTFGSGHNQDMGFFYLPLTTESKNHHILAQSTSANFVNAFYDSSLNSLLASISSVNSEDIISITMTYQTYWELFTGNGEKYVGGIQVLIDGDVRPYKKIQDDNLVTYLFKTPPNSGQIEIRPSTLRMGVDNVPDLEKLLDTLPLTYPPLKQSHLGIPFNEIQCRQNLVLIQKYDDSPACVTESTKLKLIERGWTLTNGIHNTAGSSNGHWKLKSEAFVAIPSHELTPINTVNVDEQYSATAILTKPHGMSDQYPSLGYVMYVQVLDPNGDTIAGSWHHGIIKTNQTISAGTYWSPKDTGNYTIEVFAWQSFTGTPHADVSRHTVEVTE